MGNLWLLSTSRPQGLRLPCGVVSTRPPRGPERFGCLGTLLLPQSIPPCSPASPSSSPKCPSSYPLRVLLLPPFTQSLTLKIPVRSTSPRHSVHPLPQDTFSMWASSRKHVSFSLVLLIISIGVTFLQTLLDSLLISGFRLASTRLLPFFQELKILFCIL